MRRVLLALVLLTALLTPAPSSASAPPRWLADIGDSRQVVVVTSPGWRSSYATVRAYRKDDAGQWHLKFGPWKARVGYAGMAPASTRLQDTGTTPAGTFRMLSAFGSRKDPGTRLTSYTRFDRNDWWPYDPIDPSTYNVYQRSRSKHARWRPVQAERLAHWGAGAYRYSVVLDYNLPSGVHWSKSRKQFVAEVPADTRKGGGIFLHVNGRGPTSGCVSVSYAHLRKVLRWLDSAQDPRIVIGVRDGP